MGQLVAFDAVNMQGLSMTVPKLPPVGHSLVFQSNETCLLVSCKLSGLLLWHTVPLIADDASNVRRNQSGMRRPGPKRE